MFEVNDVVEAYLPSGWEGQTDKGVIVGVSIHPRNIYPYCVRIFENDQNYYYAVNELKLTSGLKVI